MEDLAVNITNFYVPVAVTEPYIDDVAADRHYFDLMDSIEGDLRRIACSFLELTHTVKDDKRLFLDISFHFRDIARHLSRINDLKK